jgi:predicted PurR-regulated permease PerM
VANENRTINRGGTSTLLTLVIVIGALYFARVVFIPFSLAILLAFLLAPLAVRLRHCGLGRVASSIVVVLFSFLVVGVIVGFMTAQLADLAHKMPEYQQNVRQKVEKLRNSGGGMINRMTRIVRNVTDELTPPAPTPAKSRPDEEKPVPVEIRKTTFSPLEFVPNVLGSVLNLVMTALIVVVFVIFMLIQREDLRDRLIRLLGAGRVNVTTKALDEAASRVSRYLATQLVVNLVYGALVGIGLFFVGVANPLLWAILAVLLRYIPYLGIWIAALMPAAMAFAVDPGWLKVLLIFGLFIGIDVLVYNLVEPKLYGSSTGISPLAILIAAVFWTWLWGPVGLLLSTPLTVCLIVLGRYVPRLEFLSVLLSDTEVLPPETRFYQRLLAMNAEEATEVAEEFIKGKSLEELYDSLIIPALSLAEKDRHRGRLDKEREEFISKTTRFLVEDLAERSEELMVGNTKSPTEDESKPARNGVANGELTALCIPARDEADEIAAQMLVQLLNKRGLAAKSMDSQALASESLEQVGRDNPHVVCVASIPPLGYLHTRYLCRRLRTEYPKLRLIGAVLTERDVEDVKKRRPAVTADDLATSLKQAVAQILALAPTGKSHAPPPDTVAAS